MVKRQEERRQQQQQEEQRLMQQSSTSDAVLADWKWAFTQRESGGFAQYSGRYVAVLKQKDLADGDDPSQLRAHVATTHHVDPERIVVVFVDPDS